MKKPLVVLWISSLVLLALGFLWDSIVGERAPLLLETTGIDERSAFKQLGLLGCAIASVASLVALVDRGGTRGLGRKLAVLCLKSSLFIGIFLVTGEVALRAIFWKGASFSSHGGPIVRNFESEFVLNSYPGPSRGPAATGPKREGVPRILVQGDSITWGQGIRNEDDLWPTLLERRLSRDAHPVEVAVVARTGKEIDWHLEQIRTLSSAVDPDLVVYQWFVNDLEISGKDRPGATHPWRKFFLHRLLVDNSYLWFFIDFKLDQLLPAAKPGYTEYMLERFGGDTPEWRHFVETFDAWSTEAKSATERVVVLLYPHTQAPDGQPFQSLRERVQAIAEERDLVVIDLLDHLDEFQGDYGSMYASRYDGHPNERVHERMAEAVAETLRSRWPDLFPSE